MAEFNETLVRRYYELQGYLVRGNVRYRLGNGYADVDLIALNPKSGKAVAVEVKGWHTENVTRSTLDSWPNLLHFASAEATVAIRDVLGNRSFQRILVVGKLGPRSADEVRERLGQEGIEVLEFADVLPTLMEDDDVKKNADSDAEHLLRLLRIYGFLPTSDRGAPDDNATAREQSHKNS